MITVKEAAMKSAAKMREMSQGGHDLASAPDLTQYAFGTPEMDPASMDPVLRAKVVEDLGVVLTVIQQDHSRRFIERETASHLTWLTLVSGANAVLLGPPGTSKSQLVRTMGDYLVDVKMFHQTCHPATRPEDIFGGLDIPSMQNGVWRNLTEDALPGADTGFLDECFKSNPGLLTSLLEIMEPEDRRFKGDGVRTMAVFGASNETPRGLERGDNLLSPLWDRFLIRFYCSPIASEVGWTKMMFEGKQQKGENVPSITRAQLLFMQQCLPEVLIPQHVQDAIVRLRGTLLTEKIAVSDRRWAQLVRLIMPASALMNGRMYCEVEDMEHLAHCLWDLSPAATPAKVGDVVNQIAAPTANDMKIHCDAAEALLQKMQALQQRELELNAQAATMSAVDANKAKADLISAKGSLTAAISASIMTLNTSLADERKVVESTGKRLVGQALARFLRGEELVRRMEELKARQLQRSHEDLERMRGQQLGRVRQP